MHIYVTIEIPEVTDCNSPEADSAVQAVELALKNAGIGFLWWIEDAESAEPAGPAPG